MCSMAKEIAMPWKVGSVSFFVRFRAVRSVSSLTPVFLR